FRARADAAVRRRPNQDALRRETGRGRSWRQGRRGSAGRRQDPMSSSPPEETSAPQIEATIAKAEEVPFVTVRDGGRAWLRASVLCGGTLTWTTAVFGAMAENGLWTGASAGFGLSLVLIVVYVLSIRTAYGSPPKDVRQVMTRALVTMVGGGSMWSMF